MTRFPLPRTVLGWTTLGMSAWLVLMAFLALVTGQSLIVVVGGWLCLFVPVLIVMAIIDRVVSDRRGARNVHAEGAAWQQPEQPQLPMGPPPMYPQQPTYQQPAPPAAPDHNPWA